MKLIIQNNRVVATATDAYSGPDDYIDSPKGFDSEQMSKYTIVDNIAILPTINIVDVIVASTQDRLDDFAKTKKYDGILSACSYATSKIPQFALDGQTAVDLRDSTWAKLYSVLSEVQSGARPAPVGFSDIENILPVLVW